MERGGERGEGGMNKKKGGGGGASNLDRPTQTEREKNKTERIDGNSIHNTHTHSGNRLNPSHEHLAVTVFPCGKMDLHVLFCAKVDLTDVASIRAEGLVDEHIVSLEMLPLAEGASAPADEGAWSCAACSADGGGGGAGGDRERGDEGG